MEKSIREIWRESWLCSINELTSLDLQKKSWLDYTHGNPHWTYVEFMCCYFDDLALDDNYKQHLEDGLISQREYEIIEEWHTQLRKYEMPKNDRDDHKVILNDPKWLEILSFGVKVKNKLAKILNDTERILLLEEIDYRKYNSPHEQD